MWKRRLAGTRPANVAPVHTHALEAPREAQHCFDFSFDPDLVRALATVTGDDNPVHVDPAYAATTRFKKNIVHGAFLSGLISRGLGSDFLGFGTIYVAQETRYTAPVHVDETVLIELEVIQILQKGRVRIATRVRRSDGGLALEGEATVIVRREQLP